MTNCVVFLKRAAHLATYPHQYAPEKTPQRDVHILGLRKRLTFDLNMEQLKQSNTLIFVLIHIKTQITLNVRPSS